MQISSPKNLPSLLCKSRMGVLSITLEHALAAGALANFHCHALGRMFIAQVKIEGLPIVTSDPVFKQYPIELVW